MEGSEDRLVIPSNPQDIWGTLAAISGLEFLFAMMLQAGLRNRIVGWPLYSTAWWIYVVVVILLVAVTAAFIATGFYNAIKNDRNLVIDKFGIKLPYQNSKNYIKYNEISDYSTEETHTKYGDYQFFYVKLKHHRPSSYNILGLKKVLILGRKVYDNDDINNTFAMINRFYEFES